MNLANSPIVNVASLAECGLLRMVLISIHSVADHNCLAPLGLLSVLPYLYKASNYS